MLLLFDLMIFFSDKFFLFILLTFPLGFFFLYFHVEAESQLNYVSSQKGKYQLAYGGFYYVREKVVKNNKIYWRCIEYTSKLKCHARIHTIGENIVRNTPHSHDPIKAKKKMFWISEPDDQTIFKIDKY